MRFSLSDGNRFEIPDDWWVTSGMQQFERHSDAYPVKPHQRFPNLQIVLAPIGQVVPPRRAHGFEFDFGGFHRDQMIMILSGFASLTKIPPVQAKFQLVNGYDYCVYDGFHRFYASVAAGFSKLPIIIFEWGFGG